MMKTKMIFASALAAVTMLASCSKENHEGTPAVNGETTKVVLKVQDGMAVRAAGPAVSGHTIKFTSGTIYFTDVQGDILHVFPTEGLNTATDQVFEEISIKSTQVYIVGNEAGLPVAGNISAVLTKVTAVKDQYDATAKGLDQVTLYGDGTLSATGRKDDDGNDIYEAEVKVNPIASRIEFAQLTAKATDEAGAPVDADITYQVEGIFINNFYNSILVPGVLSSDNNALVFADKSTDFEAGSNKYAANLNSIIYDYDTAGIGALTDNVYAPATADAWVYNVLAPTNGVEFPRIVIALTVTEIEGKTGGDYDYDALGEKRYIVIKGFKENGVQLTTFNAGYIYKIENLDFDVATDLVITPEGGVTAEVSVTLAKWEEKVVEPIL